MLRAKLALVGGCVLAIGSGVRDHVEEVGALAPGTYALRRVGDASVTRFVVAR